MKTLIAWIALFAVSFAQAPRTLRHGAPHGKADADGVFRKWMPVVKDGKATSSSTTLWSHTVRMEDGNGQPRGSGTLVNWQGHVHILSCKHLDWGAITHGSRNGQRIPIHGGKRVFVSRDSDVAICCIRDATGLHGVDFAASSSSPVTLCGYPRPQFQLKVRQGSIFRRVQHGYDITAYADSGDSGGSVFDRSGRVAGVLVAKDRKVGPGRGNVVGISEVHRFLTRAAHVHTQGGL